MIRLSINEQNYDVDVDPSTPLLWIIRDIIGLTGTKFGCGISQCGACTIHIDGKAVRSCTLPASSVTGKEITTIEGLTGDVAYRIQKAWLAQDVVQCGYCQSGQIVSAVQLLTEKPEPTDADIDNAMYTNICRCGTYQRIRKAIHLAASLKSEAK
jgi:aerobic-type carbon monoxide dehydrogenase small subunit (CoxS/CutS family)